MPGKQLCCRSSPGKFGNSQVPKRPDLRPWPPLADAYSGGKLCSPNPGPCSGVFCTRRNYFFRINLGTDLGKSRGEGVSSCWSPRRRAGCKR